MQNLKPTTHGEHCRGSEPSDSFVRTYRSRMPPGADGAIDEVRKETEVRLLSIILALGVTVAGLAAIGASSAAAVECNEKLTEWVFCVSKVPVGAVGLAISGATIGEAKIVSAGFGLEVKCKKGKFKATLEEKGGFTPKYELEECTAPKPAGCTVGGNKITTEPILGALEPVAINPPIIKLSNATSEMTIVKFTIEGGSCAAAKTYKLWGEQKCQVNAAFETEELEHRVICVLANSKMKLEVEGSGMPQTAELEVEAKGGFGGPCPDMWSIRKN
jgi:hypothetical protein